jgi:N-acetylmuramoyl-L-alanine amidase
MLTDMPVTFFKHKQLPAAALFAPLLSLFFLFAPFAVGTGLTQNQRDELGAAIGKFERLTKDSGRGMQREAWERQAAEFERIKKMPGNFSTEAFFYEARSHEELADRSKRTTDYIMAARLYSRLAQDYPRHALADNALFNQAVILSGPLKQPDEASTVLNSLLARYPNGDMKNEALRLRDSLTAGGKPAVSRPGAAAPEPGRKSTSAAGIFQYPKGTVGVVNAKTPASGALLSLLSWDADQQLFSLTIGFAGKAKYTSSVLPPAPQAADGTGRLVLDLLDTRLDPGVKKQLRFTNLPVSEVRVSAQSGAATRLVLDLTQAQSYKITPLYNPYRLKLEISADKPLAGGHQLKPAAGASAGRPAGNPGAKPAVPGNIAQQLGLGIKTIAVDAGHGGTDPGAIGNGITESKYTLEIALLLGKRLQSKGFTVIYTRESDKKLDLKERTTLANERKADIFISIHLNSSVKKDALGLEAYYLDVARSDAASVVAARENAVDVNATSDLQFILSDLTRNAKRDESRAIATLVLERTVTKLKSGGFSVKHNGVRSAPFFVLMGARMPAFLIEVGYLSNRADAARLKNKKYLESLADGIAEGLLAYRVKINSIKP